MPPSSIFAFCSLQFAFCLFVPNRADVNQKLFLPNKANPISGHPASQHPCGPVIPAPHRLAVPFPPAIPQSRYLVVPSHLAIPLSRRPAVPSENGILQTKANFVSPFSSRQPGPTHAAESTCTNPTPPVNPSPPPETKANFASQFPSPSRVSGSPCPVSPRPNPCLHVPMSRRLRVSPSRPFAVPPSRLRVPPRVTLSPR